MLSKKFIANTFIVAFSSFLAVLVSYIVGLYPTLSPWVTIILGIWTLILIPFYFLHLKISYAIFKAKMKWRLRNPKIGIIEQHDCPAPSTSFSPANWKRCLDKLSVDSEIIPISAIDNKYVAIINPYGETYPEEDLVNLKSLKRIEKYISNGGIFVCGGGLAFFYGYDFKSDRNVPLGDPFLVYVQISSPNKPLILTSQESYPSYSLVNTILRKRFNILTSFGDTTRNTVFQTAADRKFAGDLVNIGGVSETLQFRAVREPTRRCVPLLRTRLQIAENKHVELYVVAAVPRGKGCLILCGMNLSEQPSHPLWNRNIHRANFEKICQAIVNLLEFRKKGLIPLDAEDW